ncbi:hypothetical protein [Polaribacter dokdonensis]|uniref:Diguanylate cyclase (GGDEF) domain-containing protein n=1 Tax=Polaribacter dokdonensis DSW-5 TaxID=1300348 RepID=A0A0M9CGJ2_9FLAO|nr:hypothetical protein [Polaribacter dokdonensis]KOY51966.1 Diguanylate cyclase (GGDEF) domain-containing protein [Polaribacter dokdonensis DSW-5]SED98757.1 Type IV pili methyl-accepting chemotaxis transducer N-term [Polaribacter dokdonensis DSW-5]
MKRKIVYTFITLFILLGINKYLLFTDVKQQDNNVAVVNMAGKQRMYVQQITKLALYYELSNSVDFFNITGLQETTNLFIENHSKLKANYISSYNDVVLEDLFHELQPYFKTIADSSTALIASPENNEKSKEFTTIIKTNEANFLRIMNEIVLQYQTLAQQRINEVKTREITFNITYVLIFSYVLFFIFIPFRKILIK